MKNTQDILAFVHIKKAAGTTLNHILRINFFLKHCEVKVFQKDTNDVFRAADMKKLLKINPFVRSISGHEVKPYGDLVDFIPSIRFITLLRNPVKRYLSQYQHNYEKLGELLTFEQYLQMESSFNKQTRMIAGCDDVELAKRILATRFFLVGIVEEFDEFLVLLKKKIGNKNFYLGYRQQNRKNEKSSLYMKLREQYEKYEKQIIERNKLDMELYRYVVKNLIPIEKELYGINLQIDVDNFKDSKEKFQESFLRYIDYGYRKLYLQPMIQITRKKNGFSQRQ